MSVFHRKVLIVSAAKFKPPGKGALVALGVSIVALVAASVVMFNDPGRKPDKESANKSGDPTVTNASGLSDDDYVMVGGVRRPKTDLKAQSGVPGARSEAEATEDQMADYGETPLVPADANVYTKSVAEAYKTKTHPERVSSMVPSRPFDPEVYKQNPADYLETIEPGRVFDPAQPGPDVTRLVHTAPRAMTVVQGESVPLQVKAIPDAPVTFTSFDLGRFRESLLTSVTVKADEKGIATARFEATPGTIGHVDILAASPLTSGQLRFMVNVTMPKPAGATGAAAER